MKAPISQADAENIAVEALVWLSQDKDLMSRFLALTGIEASSIRSAAQEPGFLAGVLQFYLSHEPTLMRFCDETQRDPSTIEKAAALLPGGLNHHF